MRLKFMEGDTAMTEAQKERIIKRLHKDMEEGKTFTCFLCGKELKSTDPVEYVDGRWMHTKCYNKKLGHRKK